MNGSISYFRWSFSLSALATKFDHVFQCACQVLGSFLHINFHLMSMLRFAFLAFTVEEYVHVAHCMILYGCRYLFLSPLKIHDCPPRLLLPSKLVS